MFNFFKTTFSLEINRWQGAPITTFFLKNFNLNVTNLLYHPTEESKVPINQICMFGKISSFIIFFYLILRHYSDGIMKYNNLVIFIIFLFTFLNYNAILYLIPFFLIEFFKI